ncbi:hypothetical protein [Idiomarina xiamenensis]|nr:hypothetical protein [Idiomarina xiamenensis]
MTKNNFITLTVMLLVTIVASPLVGMATPNPPATLFCASASSQYHAIKAATSTKLMSHLRKKIYPNMASFDGTPTEFFNGFDFDELNFNLQEVGFDPTLSWRHLHSVKNLTLSFSLPERLAITNNKVISEVTFTLIPTPSHIDITLNHSLTHIGGKYWSILMNPAISVVELSPCAAVALTEAFGKPQSYPAGQSLKSTYIALPDSGYDATSLKESNSNDYQLCEKHY